MHARQPSPTSGRPLVPGSLRDYPRLRLKRDVALQFGDVPGPADAQTLNISVDGMFIHSRDARPAGSSLSFELALSRSEQRIRGEGEVVWMRQFELSADRPAGMGIRFLDLDDESQRALCAFIARRHLGDEAECGTGAAEWAPAHVSPFSGLTSPQLRRLHAYAGCAAARPEHAWSRGMRRIFSLAAQAARRALYWRQRTAVESPG